MSYREQQPVPPPLSSPPPSAPELDLDARLRRVIWWSLLAALLNLFSLFLHVLAYLLRAS